MPERVIFHLSLLLLVAFFAYWLKRPAVNPVRFVRIIFLIAILGVFSLLISYSVAQYRFWMEGELGQYLLPPYQEINYFIKYALWRFFAQYLVSGFFAVIFFLVAKGYNTRHNNQFFYPEEPYYIALGIFLTGHPLWIVYLLAMLVGYGIFSIFYRLWWKRKNSIVNEEPKVSFYYGWLPVALLVILMKGTLATIPFVQVLIFARDQFIL
jgi:hypothetical protein